jgi:FixJ family two-component response regulator
VDLEVSSAVYVLDDDASVRRALARLLEVAGMRPSVYATVDQLMEVLEGGAEAGCVVADIRLGEESGLDLPSRMAGAGRSDPVIFVSAIDLSELCQLARDAGAVAYFRKPVDDQALLDAITWAIAGTTTEPRP